MSYYAIGIGGTGAKCLESLIHICAAGLMPDTEQLNILFVDPDGANGSLARASSLLSNYSACREGRVEGTDFLKTPIVPTFPENSTDTTPVIWSPLANGKHQLDDFFNANLLSPEAGHLLNLLFSPDEQKMNLDVGFRGRPAIGAAVMASSVDLNNSEPWITIKRKMQADAGNAKPVKIMLFGSIFGGTGASGFPTIATILRQWIATFPPSSNASVKLGGVLMLPYFSFAPITTERVAANSDDFLLNTQAALQYYSRRAELDVMDAVYVLGSQDRLKMRESQIGGRGQQNDPHFIELYAALGALDFFTSGDETPVDGNRYRMIARDNQDTVRWSDLPGDADVLKRKLLQLAKFSFAYLSSYHPMLENIALQGKGYRAPWFINFFHYKNVDLRTELQGPLHHVKEFCENYLLWLAKLEFSVAGKQVDRPHLLNASSFSWVEDQGAVRLRTTFDDGAFPEFELPGVEAGSLASLWERMSKAKSKGNSVNGAWYFINELYRRCGE